MCIPAGIGPLPYITGCTREQTIRWYSTSIKLFEDTYKTTHVPAENSWEQPLESHTGYQENHRTQNVEDDWGEAQYYMDKHLQIFCLSEV